MSRRWAKGASATSFFLVISLNRLEGLKVLVRFRGCLVIWKLHASVDHHLAEMPGYKMLHLAVKTCLRYIEPLASTKVCKTALRKIEVCRITHDPRASINGRIPFQVPWHAIVLNRSPTKTAAHQKQFNILGHGDHGYRSIPAIEPR